MTAALGLGFSCSVAVSAVVMWVVGATAFLAVVAVFAVAWLTACSVYRRCYRASSGGAAVMATGRARLRGGVAAEDELVERFGAWRVRYARNRVREPGDTSAVRAVAAELPDPRPVFTVHRRARHEAAHAVVALARNATIEYANITVVGEVGGEVGWTGYPRPARADHLWDILLVGLAGHIVDVDAGHSNDDCASGDFTGVHAAAFELVVNGHRPEGYDGPLELHAVVTAARDAARRIATDRSAAIDRVAAGLVEHRRLHDWEIRELAGPVETLGDAP